MQSSSNSHRFIISILSTMGDCIIIKAQYCAVDIAISLKMERRNAVTPIPNRKSMTSPCPWRHADNLRCTKQNCPRWWLLSCLLTFRCSFCYSSLLKHWLAGEYHVHIWEISQLRCMISVKYECDSIDLVGTFAKSEIAHDEINGSFPTQKKNIAAT